MRTLGYEDAEKFHRQINSRPAGRGLNVVTLALREPTISAVTWLRPSVRTTCTSKMTLADARQSTGLLA